MIISASKSHYGAYAKLKRDYALLANYSLNQIEAIDYKADFTFTWYRKNRRSDPDNIAAGGCKVILDAMVDKGILANDGHKEVGSLTHYFDVDKDNPRVIIQVKPSNS